MKDEWVNCEACVDCLMYIANGDVPDDDESFLERFDHSVSWDTGWYEELTEEEQDNEDGDLGFSWRSCDCCNSHLGGERYKVAYKAGA